MGRDDCRQNAAANRLEGPGLTFTDCDSPLLGDFTIVLANILAGPLTVLAPAICTHVAAGGWLVLAGILPPQVEQLRAAYAPWLQLEVSAEREGWVLLTGQRPC
jgi:LSU ribosomal protein L11P methyltransferase (EC 2.1.1.-)